MYREELIQRQAKLFGEDSNNIPRDFRKDFMVQVAIKNAFAAGAHWADENPKIEPIKQVDYANLVFSEPEIEETEYKIIHKMGYGHFNWIEEFCDTPEECEFLRFGTDPVFDEKKKKYVKKLTYFQCPSCNSDQTTHFYDGDYKVFKCKDCGYTFSDQIIYRD